MEKQTSEFQKLMDLIRNLENLKTELYQQYSRTVDLIIADKIADKAEIETVLESLLDFGSDERFFDLFRRLGQYLYTHRPDVAVEHRRIFQMLSKEERHNGADHL